jgi:SAM-dependent methyltransferase
MMPGSASLPCPLGGTMALRWTIPHAWTGPSREFGLYWAEVRGYGQIYPMPTQSELQQFYAMDTHGDAAGIDAQRQLKQGAVSRLLDRVIYGISSPTSQGEISNVEIATRLMSARGRVCSIGLDPLGMLDAIADQGHEVVSVERVPIQRNGHRDDLKILPGTAELIPGSLEPGTFDVVAMVHSLSRVRDPWLAIGNATKLLKPGGHIWIDVPNFASRAFDLMGPAWFHADAGRHLHFFSGRSLAEIMRQTGLEIREVHHFGYSRQFYWTRVERDLWLRLYRNSREALRYDAPPLPGTLSKLRLLALTLFAEPGKRHDSVRVIARKPQRL